MPLKKPQSAVIFNNFVYKKGAKYVFRVGQDDWKGTQHYNIPFLINDAFYICGDSSVLKGSLDLNDYNMVKLANVGVKVGKSPSSLFPTKFSPVIIDGKMTGMLEESKSSKSYYDEKFAFLTKGKDEEAVTDHLSVISNHAGVFNTLQTKLKKEITDLDNKEAELYTVLKHEKFASSFKKLHPSKYRLEIDAKAFAVLDHLYDEETKKKRVVGKDFKIDKKIEQLGPCGGPGLPKCPPPPNPNHYEPGFFPFKIVSGIDAGLPASFLALMLIPNSVSSFNFHNFELNNDNQSSKLNVVAPVSFFKKYFETKEEPKVPPAANENNVLSFYQQELGHPDKFDEKTFIYQGKPFANFETEVLTTSTLIEKSGKYVDFVKPYSSLEFYVNFKSDEQSKKVNEIAKDLGKYQYLKRFVSNQKSISQNLQGVLLKNGESLVNLHSKTAFGNGKFLSNTSYDEKFASDPWHGHYNIDSKSRISSLHQIIDSGELCPFEVVGYIITKSTAKKGTSGYSDSIIKRIYIMNDKPGFAGYLKYFDSQIKEDQTYYYNIEQINHVYGVKLVYQSLNSLKECKAKCTQDNIPAANACHKKCEVEFATIRDFFPYDSAAANAPYDFISNLTADQTTLDELATSDDNEILPFYKSGLNNVDITIGFGKYDIVVHTPTVTPDKLDSPDLELASDITKVKPLPPDIQIYTQEGVTNKAMVLLSAITGKDVQFAGLAGGDKSNVILLGNFNDMLTIPVKEYRVYRTKEKPDSYESFSKKPHEILDPKYPDFVDDVLPNIEYYYYATAIGTDGAESDPTRVVKMVIVNEHSHVFTLLETYEFGQDKKPETERLFKKRLNVSPTFLQSALKPSIFVPGYYVE